MKIRRFLPMLPKNTQSAAFSAAFRRLNFTRRFNNKFYFNFRNNDMNKHFEALELNIVLDML